MAAQLEKRYFSVDEYYRMVGAGVLTPDDRLELIEGEIVKMSPIGSPHAACVSRLDDLLRGLRKTKAMIRIQSPARLNDFSEPIPDLVLVKPRKDYYAAQHPRPSDVLLVVEVAETTVVSDRQVKVPLYARHGVPEVWLVNLPKKLIEKYFDPANGPYTGATKYKRGEIITSASVPGISLRVIDILG